ncbi:MAG: DUF1599 domain-containing protein [Turicibacter sp.]|nr:DUF1599 domain-containing protein [Turicibacter sp.]
MEKHNKINKFIKDRLLVYLCKNRDYGDSFNEAFRKYGDVSALVRMEDKVNRYSSLQNKNAMVHDESLQDTLLDLFNYMMMYSCARELTPGEDTMVVKLVYKMHEEAKMILECNLEQSFIFNTLKHEMQFSYELCESIIHDLKQAFE